MCWHKTLEVFDESTPHFRSMSRFLDDHELPAEAVGSLKRKFDGMLVLLGRNRLRARLFRKGGPERTVTAFAPVAKSRSLKIMCKWRSFSGMRKSRHARL